jgi:hypothetical protein
MRVETILTMIFSLGIVWGGFILILLTAIRKEKLKQVDK